MVVVGHYMDKAVESSLARPGKPETVLSRALRRGPRSPCGPLTNVQSFVSSESFSKVNYGNKDDNRQCLREKRRQRDGR